MQGRDARDDFPEPVKRDLCDRVGGRCSKPECQVFTKGPRADSPKATSIGRASHIRAAAAGGPRYDASQTPEQRRSFENGIFGDLGVCLHIYGKQAPRRFNIGYGVDPLSGTMRRFDDWAGAVGAPGEADHDALVKTLTNAVAATVTFAEHRNADRAQKELIETALHEAFVDVPEGAPIPQEALEKLSRLVAERFVDRQFRIESSRPAPALLARLTAASNRKK